MRLHIFFLSAAVFLFVGIVFAVAEESTDKENRETAQTVGSPSVNNRNAFPQPFHDASRSKNLTITLSQYRDSAKTESGRALDTPAIRLNDSNAALSKTSASYHTDFENAPHVYDFAVPSDDSVLKEIGITERNDSDRASSSTEVASEETAAYQISDNGASSNLVFEKKAFKNGLNRPKIISGGFKSDNFEIEKDVTANPLSIPFMILALALTFFVFVIIFTMNGVNLDN